ncbi:MAG: His-Xaa-Ser system protein HxsD [Myxococcales bacterium]|nr:His-Xaa-Ser system protein HxsD [Myxococcales bacterium]
MGDLETVKIDVEQGVAVLSLDKGLYPLDVVYGAAYVLIDRAYVLLDRAPDGRFLIRLQVKEGPLDTKTLTALAGEMQNELLSQALRRKITKANKQLLETIVTRAIGGATGALTPGVFPEEDDLDFLDDPLGIAVPWEERFSKDAKKDKPTDAETTPELAGPGDSGGFSPTKKGSEP